MTGIVISVSEVNTEVFWREKLMQVVWVYKYNFPMIIKVEFILNYCHHANFMK